MKKVLIIATCLLANYSMHAQKRDSVVPCVGNINQFDPNRDMKNCYLYDTAHIQASTDEVYCNTQGHKKRHRNRQSACIVK